MGSGLMGSMGSSESRNEWKCIHIATRLGRNISKARTAPSSGATACAAAVSSMNCQRWSLCMVLHSQRFVDGASWTAPALSQVRPGGFAGGIQVEAPCRTGNSLTGTSTGGVWHARAPVERRLRSLPRESKMCAESKREQGVEHLILLRAPVHVRLAGEAAFLVACRTCGSGATPSSE